MTRSRRLATTTGRTTGTTGEGPVLTKEIDTVLVKTASRCNLDCTYCYVYNSGDDGWKSQPRRMPADVRSAVVDQVGKLSHAQIRPLSLVLHGGEPLLLGLKDMERLVDGLKGSLRADAGVHVQTNGVLLTDEFIDLFARYDVGISISLDGPVEIHDKNRVDHHGRGSHARVTAAVARLIAHPAGTRLFGGLLAVVDPSSDPAVVYDALKATGVPSFDFLYRDGNYEALPQGKSGIDSTEFGQWMIGLLIHYLADPSPPRIRFIDDIMRLLLGAGGQKEGVGLNEFGIIVIDTDGAITRNDTLKVAYSGADRFVSAPSVLSNRTIMEQIEGGEFAEYFELQIPTSPICQACSELHVCGGGMPAHRWSEDRGYVNPTVFCADQKLVISTVRSRLERSTALPLPVS